MKYFVYALIPLLCFMAVLFLVIEGVYTHESETQAITKANAIAKETTVEFNYLIRPLLSSNAYLARSNFLKKILSDEGEKSAVENDFSLLAQTHPVFQQVRLLDTSGNEVLRVNYNNDGLEKIGDEELQDKSHRGYFKKAKNLKPDQIYVTPISLNLEHNNVERPYSAVFRIISPVDTGETRMGYLVYNVSVERVISLLDVQAGSDYSQLMLLNSSGEGLRYTGDKIDYLFSNSDLGSFDGRASEVWNLIGNSKRGNKLSETGVYAWTQFDLNESSKSFPENISFLEPRSSSFKVLICTPIVKGNLISDLRDIDKLLIIGLLIAFLVLAANYSWGRVQSNKRHHLISNLNDELIKSQANLNSEKNSLKKVLHELTLRNNQLTEFSSIISHNIRAPLSSLTLLIQFLRNNYKDLAEESRKEAFDKLQMSSDSLHSLAKDLWSAVEILDSKDVKMEKVDINAILLKATDQLRNEIKESSAQIKTDFSTWFLMTYNKAYLQSILVNLISNSIKYRSPERDVIIEIVAEKFQGKSVLKVMDNGRGINMDWHSNSVFGMHRTFHGDVAGRGMGLFMVKMQVEALGGNIFVESEDGKGSTFTIMF
ncbi:signal transduction histidine kinase [Owenweeksia hongkongensis DSM 17368]|uniref:histidine kinase n=1 Tax=Owenweeksia hongkongensis (strain DSM 17368 / CIP 108786 / JCM 12287 / NRRL B-23963 / UST20020801) TaxID=926562 RepID=G8R5P2_OWEHD|nr:ATP-binding protein [Owenweeksia hongkongensis]AEV34358.1 signal transduction histidine kinase [Owenweeksia hongkongensis DSM 17368]